MEDRDRDTHFVPIFWAIPQNFDSEDTFKLTKVYDHNTMSALSGEAENEGPANVIE
jgi:hypothetical protein